MDTSSSSKVTVEYHDPSGIFPLVSQDIAARLPLRNLNWQSLLRPLRQIKSLHVDFVPDEFTKNSLRPTNGSEGPNSLDIVRSGTDFRKSAVKERRHQIPGLQTSPYLRVYLLRCDDKETYKASQRQKLKEWIRDSATSSTKGKNKSDNHDASEWLILHVVIPDTIAASQPRWREASSKDVEDLKERSKGGAKWPGKSKRTVFDKLRSDFNDSGKSKQDRVAQIKLPKDQVPAELLPTVSLAETLEETPEEREKAWNDLMNKFKLLILGPFDLRVRQYESDIAAQESRRSMPGFNFCTFFIHKEGLAKALESIGLVEDALVIYDELSLGLESVLKDISNGQAEGNATTFAPYTDGIEERIVGTKKPELNGTGADDTKGGKNDETAEITETDYRGRIVRSSISAFDFCCYLFSRQKSLILRLANAKVARTELGSFTKEGGEDLVLISEVCWRAASFIHNNARKLRQDLLGYRSQREDVTLSDADIDSLVCSWTYAVAGKVLEETSSSTLDQDSDNGRQEGSTNGAHKLRRSEFFGLGVSAYPQRTTSLPPRQSRVLELQKRESLQSASENNLMSRPSSSGTDENRPPTGGVPGLPELVTYRADLVMVQRKALEQAAKQRGWLAGWALVRNQRTSKLEEIDLNGEVDGPANDVDKRVEPSILLSAELASALDSEQDYHEMYVGLSNEAMRYYTTSTQTKSVETIVGDLAILKYQQGDLEYAVSYFQHVLPLYASEGWSLMEAESLNMHAKCLRDLDRKEEYVKTLLRLLAKVCGHKKERKLPRMKFEVVDDEAVDVNGVFAGLVTLSKELDLEITSSAEDFFSDIRLEPEVMFHEDRDGFKLRLHLRHLLNDEIQLDQVSVHLVHVDDPSQEVFVSHLGPISIVAGANDIDLISTTVVYGAFFIDKMMLQAGKLRFEQDLKPYSEANPSSVRIPDDGSKVVSETYEPPWLFLYPRRYAFNAEIALARNVDIEEARFLEIKLDSGRNEIQSLDLRLKSGSAGLRLHSADATIIDIDERTHEDPTPGEIRLGIFEASSSALVQVPFKLEQSGQDILVRLEARYQTTKGSFMFVTSAKLPTRLPLDIEANDIFHLDALFSRFTVRTTSQSPLFITQAEVDPSAVYEVVAPPMMPMPMIAFESQPVRLLFKITRDSAKAGGANKKDASLALNVYYHLAEELLIHNICTTFADALECTSFKSLSRLLVPLFASRIKKSLSKGDIEMAVLLNEAEVLSFDGMLWQEIIVTLPAAIRQELTEWLKQWHMENTRIIVGNDHMQQDLQHCITMAVDVPNIDIVHKASLSLLNEDILFEHDVQILALGQPVQAQLKLTCTRKWSAKAIFHAHSGDKDSSMDFMFEVQADPDSWIVGGQRRARFTAKEGVELVFELLLIPLRLGTYPLPPVRVQAELANQDGQNKEAIVSCETYCESAGQLVQVIRDSRMARVRISESSGRPPSQASVAMTTKESG